MSCYKIDRENAWFVCPCGLGLKVKISDLDYDTATILFPECPECGRRSSLFVNDISEEEEEKNMPESILSRNVLNQTLFQRVLVQGKEPIFGTPAPEKDDLTRLVSENDLVEASLHPKIAAAREKRLAS